MNSRSTKTRRLAAIAIITVAISLGSNAAAQSFGVAHIEGGAVVNQTAGFDLQVNHPGNGVYELGIGGIPGTPLTQQCVAFDGGAANGVYAATNGFEVVLQ